MSAPISLKGLKAQQEWKFSKKARDNWWATLFVFCWLFFLIVILLFVFTPMYVGWIGFYGDLPIRGTIILSFGYLYYFMLIILSIPLTSCLYTLGQLSVKVKLKELAQKGWDSMLAIALIFILFIIFKLSFLNQPISDFIYYDTNFGSILLSNRMYYVPQLTIENIVTALGLTLLFTCIFSTVYYFLTTRIVVKCSLDEEIRVSPPYLVMFMMSPFTTFTGFLFFDTINPMKFLVIGLIWFVIFTISSKFLMSIKWRSALIAGIFFSISSMILAMPMSYSHGSIMPAR